MSPKCHYKSLFLPYQVLKNAKFWAEEKIFRIAFVFNELVQKMKELTTLSSCKLFISSCHNSNALRCHNPVVDADVIDQAGEEGTCLEVAADAKIQVAVCVFQAI